MKKNFENPTADAKKLSQEELEKVSGGACRSDDSNSQAGPDHCVVNN